MRNKFIVFLSTLIGVTFLVVAVPAVADACSLDDGPCVSRGCSGIMIDYDECPMRDVCEGQWCEDECLVLEGQCMDDGTYCYSYQCSDGELSGIEICAEPADQCYFVTDEIEA